MTSTASILLVIPTILEAKPFLRLNHRQIDKYLYQFESPTLHCDLLIGGIGQLTTTFRLSHQLDKKPYRFILMAGIAGSYSTTLPLGKVVNVMEERFGDLGIESGSDFSDLFDMKLDNPDVFPFSEGVLVNYTLINNDPITRLPIVKGNTVQTIRTSIKPSIQREATVESMEGAAFFYVCMMKHQAFVELRAISNYVGETDKSQWETRKAIENLYAAVIEVFAEIQF
jgi:futalosine hydrolase